MPRPIVSFRLPLLVLAAPLVLACAGPSLMVESEGRRVFNPAYRYFLTWTPRDWWQRPDEVVAALAIAPGQSVADVGAGNGYFVDRLAAEVGPTGRVFATDVQHPMLEDLEARVNERALTNVAVVRGEFDRPALPDACCDLMLFANVYKEIDDRVSYMKHARAALRPGGRIAILGFRADVRGPGPPASARLPAERVIEELRAAGFELGAQHEFLPRQYLLVFEDPAAGLAVTSGNPDAAR